MKETAPQHAICFVLSSTFALNAFLLNHLRALADSYAVTVCVNRQESPVSPLLDSRIELLHFPIAREIRPFRDLYALGWLILLFRRRKFDAVHTLTPKGGLLGILAAFISRIPQRTHTFTGQVWANRQGFRRAFLKSFDRIIAICAVDLLADSPSQKHFLENEKVCKVGAIQVFGNGSISGVDLNRFSVQPIRRESFRAQWDIPADAVVFLYLGRIHRDKGVMLLAEAYARLHAQHPEAWLLYVGPDEQHMVDDLLQLCGAQSHAFGLTDCPEMFLDGCDVLCLPSYREGFGNVVIEAGAMALPAIASNIYGLIDAVVDGKTGLLFSVGDVHSLQCAMAQMLDSSLRTEYGQFARQHVQSKYSASLVTAEWIAFYAQKLPN